MRVEAILRDKGANVATTRPEVSVSSVVRRLKLERIGALVVTGDDDRIEGMISERDVVQGLASHGADLMELRVSDLMTRNVITCTADDTMKHLMTTMTQHRIRHLPVVVDGKLGGLVSIGDVVKNRLEEVELEANVLRDAYMSTL